MSFVLNRALNRTCVNNKLLFQNIIRASSQQQNNGKQIVNSDYCKPVAAYSAAVKANGLIFVSGQLGMSDGKFVSDDVKDQTHQALVNLKGIVDDAGSNLNKVCKTTILMENIEDFGIINTTYAEFFKQSNVASNELPARAAYSVKALPLGAKVEIEAIAIE